MKKYLFIFLLSLFTFQPCFAQEEESTTAPAANAGDQMSSEEGEDGLPVETKTQVVKAITLSSIMWNDTLKLQQGITTDKDFANYNGLILGVQRDVLYHRWGWSLGGFIGSGRANGGGVATNLTYQQDKVPFTVYGVSPRIFYRHTGRINLGITGLAFMKSIAWPTDGTINIDSGRNLNMMAMLDLNIRLFPRWDFYSGIGPLREGATLWKIGLNYRY